MSDQFPDLRNHRWGVLSIGLGGIALILTMVVIFAGPFAPQHSVGTSIGEIIGEISTSAFKSAMGQELPPPVSRPWDIDRILLIAGPVLAVLAILSAIISMFQRDPWRLPTYGVALGVGAILVQFLWWLVLIVAGVMLLVSILENGPSFLEF
jgi:hypothetical protein